MVVAALTKWNEIKGELIAMHQVVKATNSFGTVNY